MKRKHTKKDIDDIKRDIDDIKRDIDMHAEKLKERWELEKSEVKRNGLNVNEFARKFIHISSLSIPVAIYFIESNVATVIVAFFAFTCLGIDLLRVFSARFRRSFSEVFGELLREDEQSQRLTGATYLFLASLICVVCYSREVAALAVLFLILGDSAASLVGSHFGKTKIWKNKSLVGSLSCLLACVLVAFFIPILEMRIAIAGALVATIVELVPGVINDNLAMPTISGLVMELLLKFSSW